MSDTFLKAKYIWEIQPCNIDAQLFDRVKRAYLESTPLSLL